MKQWQEKLPTFNLLLICIILIILIFSGFILGPVNQISLKNDEILKKLYSRYDIESCAKFDGYYINREMYVASCTVNKKEYYFFLDKNGILFEQLRIDRNKEINDYQSFIEKYELIKPEFKVIYYNDQLAYWIKSVEYEYILGYESYEVLMKVRF